MSSCWRCGKPLPDGQTECEDNCVARAGTGSDVFSVRIDENEKDFPEVLKHELEAGRIAANALACHFLSMGCTRAELRATYAGVTCKIIIEII